MPVFVHPLARVVLILLGLMAVALGLGLLIEGETDEPEEILFAAAVLATGVLNVAAGSLVKRMRGAPAVAVTADALLLGFVAAILSQASIG